MQSTTRSEIQCECPCGAIKLTLRQLPITRFSCHCKICQAVYRKPCSDETIVWARDVAIDGLDRIEFKRYRRPPAAPRGICGQCGSPVIAFFSMTPLMRIAIVPSHLYVDQTELPPSRAHVFYETRTRDIDDELPKHSGYMSSQFAALRLILGGAATQTRQNHCLARNRGVPAA